MLLSTGPRRRPEWCFLHTSLSHRSVGRVVIGLWSGGKTGGRLGDAGRFELEVECFPVYNNIQTCSIPSASNSNTPQGLPRHSTLQLPPPPLTVCSKCTGPLPPHPHPLLFAHSPPDRRRRHVRLFAHSVPVHIHVVLLQTRATVRVPPRYAQTQSAPERTCPLQSSKSKVY